MAPTLRLLAVALVVVAVVLAGVLWSSLLARIESACATGVLLATVGATASKNGPVRPTAPCVCRPECDVTDSSAVLATTEEWRALLRSELDYYLNAHVYMRGLLDTEAVSWMVAKILPRYDTRKMFAIDIGANVGQTADVLMRAFNNGDCYKLVKDIIEPRGPLDLNICSIDGRPALPIISFEPDPNNFELAAKAGTDNRWYLRGWRLIPLAVSSFVGQANFYISVPGSETSALFKPEHKQRAVVVNVTTLDTFITDPANGLDQLQPFFVKIDTEGFDPDVLEGAANVLQEHRIKFIVFEYNHVWAASVANASPEDKQRKKLQTVVGKLHRAGYICMLIGPRTFIPVTPPNIWIQNMEFNQWSNVFCGLEEDPEYCEITMGASSPQSRLFLESYFNLLRKKTFT